MNAPHAHPCERCGQPDALYRLCLTCEEECALRAQSGHMMDCPHTLGWLERPCECAVIATMEKA